MKFSSNKLVYIIVSIIIMNLYIPNAYSKGSIITEFNEHWLEEDIKAKLNYDDLIAYINEKKIDLSNIRYENLIPVKCLIWNSKKINDIDPKEFEDITNLNKLFFKINRQNTNSCGSFLNAINSLNYKHFRIKYSLELDDDKISKFNILVTNLNSVNIIFTEILGNYPNNNMSNNKCNIIKSDKFTFTVAYKNQSIESFNNCVLLSLYLYLGFPFESYKDVSRVNIYDVFLLFLKSKYMNLENNSLNIELINNEIIYFILD